MRRCPTKANFRVDFNYNIIVLDSRFTVDPVEYICRFQNPYLVYISRFVVDIEGQ